MTDQALTTRPMEPELTPFEVIEKVVGSGDLARMTPQERVAFYWRTCESLGLNPMTRPFQFIQLNNKLTMYATKDATDQLRRLNSVSVTKLDRERVDDLAMVTAYGRDRSGREDSALGAVSIIGLKGEALANAWMKAETKAKRRMTLSLVGLGFLDEAEIEGIGTLVDVDHETGVIAERAEPKTLIEQVKAQTETLAVNEPVEPTSIPVVSPLRAKPESTVEPVEEATFMQEPMPVEASAALPIEGAAIVEPDETEEELLAAARLATEAENAAQATAVTEEVVATETAPKGLSVQELAAAAKVGNIGKAAFAKALNVPAADLGKTIEGMTDQQRHDLGLSLGIVAG